MTPLDGWSPTHTASEVPMRAWAAPDPAGPVVTTLGPRLPVRVVERRGDWANIQCSNGWMGWVDARQLRSVVATAPAPQTQPTAPVQPAAPVAPTLPMAAASSTPVPTPTSVQMPAPVPTPVPVPAVSAAALPVPSPAPLPAAALASAQPLELLRRRRRRRARVIRTATILLMLGAIGAGGCGALLAARNTGASGSNNTATVIYEPPLSPGADPFTPPTDVARTTAAGGAASGAGQPATSPTSAPGAATPAAGAQPPAAAPAPAAPAAPAMNLPAALASRPVVAANGEIGGFGGTGSNTTCDRELLIRDLEADPAALRAWAGVVGIPESTVPAFIRALHPAVLAADTRVTNHALVNGQALPHQSILPRGTAVLVDDSGRLVARCRCGNPLTNAVPIGRGVCQGCPSGYTPPTPAPPGTIAPIAMDPTAPGVRAASSVPAARPPASTALPTPPPATNAPPPVALAPTAPVQTTPAPPPTAPPPVHTPVPPPPASVPDSIQITQNGHTQTITGVGSGSQRTYSFAVTTSQVTVSANTQGPQHYQMNYTDASSSGTQYGSYCHNAPMTATWNGYPGTQGSVTIALVNSC